MTDKDIDTQLAEAMGWEAHKCGLWQADVHEFGFTGTGHSHNDYGKELYGYPIFTPSTDLNHMTVVRRFIAEKGLQSRFAEDLCYNSDAKNHPRFYSEMFVLVDAPAAIQARSALKVLQGVQK